MWQGIIRLHLSKAILRFKAISQANSCLYLPK